MDSSLDHIMHSLSVNTTPMTPPQLFLNAKRSPSQTSTAEKRASHNAIERARREVLNLKFTDLAQLLPTLANNKKPSKSAIITSSYDYILELRQRCEIRQRLTLQLLHQNAELKHQVQQLRNQLGLEPQVFPEIHDEEAAFDISLRKQREYQSVKKRKGSSIGRMFMSSSLPLSTPPSSSLSTIYSASPSSYVEEEEEEELFPGSLPNHLNSPKLDYVFPSYQEDMLMHMLTPQSNDSLLSSLLQNQ